MQKIIVIQQYVLDPYINNGKYIFHNLPVFINPNNKRFSMATKIECDRCQKTVNEDETFQIKAKSRSTNNVLVVDLCHTCFIDPKGTFGEIPKKWKKWSMDKKAYVNAE